MADHTALLPGALLDIESIKQLKARYFRLMDTKDWDGLAGVFAPDVEIDMRGEGAERVLDLTDYMPYLRSNIEQVVTVHHGHMPEIDVTSPTTATGVWAMEDELWWPDGAPLRHLHGYGHYHETYRKVDGEWKIATMTLTRLRRDIELT